VSLTDAATVEMISRFKMGLATYDERSFAKYVKNIVGRGFWQKLTAQEKKEAEEIDQAK